MWISVANELLGHERRTLGVPARVQDRAVAGPARSSGWERSRRGIVAAPVLASPRFRRRHPTITLVVRTRWPSPLLQPTRLRSREVQLPRGVTERALGSPTAPAARPTRRRLVRPSVLMPIPGPDSGAYCDATSIMGQPWCMSSRARSIIPRIGRRHVARPFNPHEAESRPGRHASGNARGTRPCRARRSQSNTARVMLSSPEGVERPAVIPDAAEHRQLRVSTGIDPRRRGVLRPDAVSGRHAGFLVAGPRSCTDDRAMSRVIA